VVSVGGEQRERENEERKKSVRQERPKTGGSMDQVKQMKLMEWEWDGRTLGRHSQRRRC
jgi:hypothetical protein